MKIKAPRWKNKNNECEKNTKIKKIKIKAPRSE